MRGAVRIVEERPALPLVPRMYGARSLSQRLNISRSLIYRAHATGRLPGFRLLGTLRFLETDILELLRAEGVPLGEGE